MVKSDLFDAEQIQRDIYDCTSRFCLTTIAPRRRVPGRRGTSRTFFFWGLFLSFYSLFQEENIFSRRPPAPSHRPVRRLCPAGGTGPVSAGAGSLLAACPASPPQPRIVFRCWRPRRHLGNRSRPDGCPDGGTGVLTAHRRPATLSFPRVQGLRETFSCAENSRSCAGCARGISRLRRGRGVQSRAQAAVRLPTPARVDLTEVPSGRGAVDAFHGEV